MFIASVLVLAAFAQSEDSSPTLIPADELMQGVLFVQKTRGIRMAPRGEDEFIASQASPLNADLNVFFERNKHDLTPRAKAQLDEWVIALESKGVASDKIEIQGHTCDLGDSLLNQSLSERRAQSVVDYFGSQGVFPKRFDATGFGEQRRIQMGTTEAERQENRRARIIICPVAESSRSMSSSGLQLLEVHFETDNKVDIEPGDSLSPGTGIRTQFTVLIGSHVYIAYVDSYNDVHWFAPEGLGPEYQGAWFRTGQSFTVPPLHADTDFYTLGDEQSGDEMLAVIAVPQKLESLAVLEAGLRDRKESSELEELLTSDDSQIRAEVNMVEFWHRRQK